jgi:hypothetical protein
MSSACRLSGTGAAICLLFLGTAKAETRESRVRAGQVEVRSGPSNNFYATSKLHQGDLVTILEEKDGWLTIKPPTPGRDSFSWIEARAGQQQGRTFIVTAVQTKVRIGSSLVNQPPSVEGVTLTRGTQLYVIGPARSSADGTWLPIVPAPTEVRYLPASAVQNDAVAAPTPPPPMAQGQGGSLSPSYSPTPPESKTILAQAEQAEKAGKYGEALSLYDQLARQALATDYDLAIKYQNRIECIRAEQRASAAAASSRGNKEHQDGRMAGSPVSNAGYAAATGYSQLGPGAPADPRYTVRLVPPAVNNSPAVAPGQWYEPGWLVRTTLVADEDHRPIYRYVPLSGHTWSYVTAGPNVGLEPYVNRIVTLFGNMQYHSTLRYWYLDVQQVSMQQQ